MVCESRMSSFVLHMYVSNPLTQEGIATFLEYICTGSFRCMTPPTTQPPPPAQQKKPTF